MLRIDTEFRDLCPPPTTEELDGLRADVLERGLLSPLVAWGNPDDKKGPILLDGHNRHGILLAAGLPTPEPRTLRFSCRSDAAQWIIRNQMGRRNLSASQRAMMSAKLETLKQGRPKENMPVGTITRKEAAETTNVSPRSVARAAVVLDKGAPALVKAVETGKVSVSAAAKMAEVLPAKQQQAVLVLPPAERDEAVGRIVHGPAEVSRAIAEALTTNNGLAVMEIAVVVATSELERAFDRKWIKTLNKDGVKKAAKMLNQLLLKIELLQEGLTI